MATVMSAFLVDLAAAVKVVADDKAGKTMGVADEAGRLHAMLRKAASFAGGAEEREMQDADVRFWVHKLRELAYHVEDAVDTYALQAAERREMEQRAKKSVMHRMAVFLIVNRSKFQLLKHRMKSLVQKMDDILMTAKQLQIVQIDQRDEIIPVDATNQDCIVRNDAETAGLIESLTKEDKMTSVVAIIGLGGLGKTTIARKIHDDQQIVATFSIRLWVCVSKDFTDVGLLSSIVAAAGGVVLKGVETRAQLQRMLAGIIKGKRFLLVLDDVWCGRTYEELIQSSLRGAAEGSRILVTARSRSVAEQMKACHIHKMPALTDNASFSLLYQTAGIADEHVNQGIISDAADKIVKSCNNLPMAIQIMGGILRTKVPSALEWLKVHESEGWSFKNIPEGSEGVMRAICLSYVNLPSHLKQCFIYCCSLFPAGSAIARSFITRLWITEGLARCKGETTAEEVADGYYKELVFRSLLQPQPGRDDIEECTVHYIVHSFAQFLTRDEILATNVKHLEGFSIGIRCLSVANRGLTAIPDEVRRLTSLRTLLLFGNPLGDHALAELFRRLHYLRVLDLSATAVEHIPENIGNLRYLRYLNVSQTRIRKLPDSLGSLKNLSHLDTKNCDCLHSIPEDIRKLCNLRYLDLEGTAVEKFPQNITNLQQLSLLHGFVANKADACQREQTGWSLAELKPMTNLRSLQLLKLERALVTEAEKVLIGMIHLKELQLCCSTKDYDPREHQENTDELTQIKALFDNLCPPASVESLQIKFYYGKAPVWMSNSHLCNLQKLAIFECNYIDSLSDMSVLLKLRSLSIINCQKLQHIELGRTSKIEELHLKGIPELEFLSGFDGVEQPRLQELRLENCPKLKALPAKFKDAQKLTRMEIRHACSLQVISEIPALEELVVEDAPELTEITSLAALKVLTVRFCKGLAQLKEVASLCHLHFEDDQMTELPRWLRKYASGLQSLKIVGRVELLDNCSSQEGLRVIRRIGVVSANLPDGTAYFSYSCSSGKVWFLQRKDNPVDTATLRCFDMPVLQDSSNKATVLAYNSNVDLHWLTTIKEITIHPLFVTLIMSLVGFLSYHDTFLHERLDEPVDRQDLLVLFAFVFLMQSGLFKHLSSIWKMFSQIVDDARKRIYGIARIKEKVEGISFDVPNMLLLSFCCIITLFSIHNMIHMKLLVLLCMLVFVYSIFVLALVILKVVKGR